MKDDQSKKDVQIKLDRKMFVRTVRSMAVALLLTMSTIALINYWHCDGFEKSIFVSAWPPNLILIDSEQFNSLPPGMGSKLTQITSSIGAIWFLWFLWNILQDARSESYVYITGLMKVSFFALMVCIFDIFFAFKITNGESIFTLNVRIGYFHIYVKSVLLIIFFYLFLRIFIERVILYVKTNMFNSNVRGRS
ncbi:hypothetical protein QFZ88_001770 [Mesorhizobium sp. YL-MeA3-2017]|jgi:hypothetical protein|nr:hypothetical protein [Mesorhizobium sp. YL-MeA3-2017]